MILYGLPNLEFYRFRYRDELIGKVLVTLRLD